MIYFHIHRFETDFEELSYTLILILYFSVFYSFWYIGIIRSLIKWWKVVSALNPCCLNISINVVYEAQRKVTVSKGTLHPKFIISFLMHEIFKFVQIMTIMDQEWVFIIKKNIELRKLVYRIFDLVMPIVMCGSGIGGGMNFTICWIYLCYNTKVWEYLNYSGRVVIHILNIVYYKLY